MDKCSSDAEFDSYWDYEAKNKNRNRIRVGRQYQATVPPLLKPGEKDGRKSEDLETLKWKPDKLTEQEVEQYLSMAKGIGLFAKAIDNSRAPEKTDNSLQSAIKGLSEFVASHHPCHHDDGCQVPQPSSSGESASKTNDWSPSEAQLFAQALEACGKNFCAIKKEYLPWKPVRSIIEYYYQGKTETDTKPFDLLKEPKQEPTPSCSHDEKPFQIEVPSPEKSGDSPCTENTPKDAVNFLEHSRVTEHCKADPDLKAADPLQTALPSTVGSLKFFLGGRLVLKLNARQDSGSGTKCQWVQSNDLPKLPNPSKKVKKKEDVKKCDDPPLWMPPVAEGPVEMDDASSKTSEGSPKCVDEESALSRRTPHSSSPLSKQWNKWSKSPIKDIPLDLTSKVENCSGSPDQSEVKAECCSPKVSSNGGPLSPKDFYTEPPFVTNEFSPPYSYCHRPYHCALPKCTKDYTLQDHLCNKKDADKNPESNPSYIMQEEGVCKKNWCSQSYLQYYPQCYPYYLTYASPVTESTAAEVPLDLSASENAKDDMPEKIPDDIKDVAQNNSEAVERGMLYQLLKNKTSK